MEHTSHGQWEHERDEERHLIPNQFDLLTSSSEVVRLPLCFLVMLFGKNKLCGVWGFVGCVQGFTR